MLVSGYRCHLQDVYQSILHLFLSINDLQKGMNKILSAVCVYKRVLFPVKIQNLIWQSYGYL